MLKIFEDVRIIHGYSRSMIYDITRGDYQFIPNFLAKYMAKYDGKIELKSITQSLSNATIREYYDFLVKNEFICDISNVNLKNFTKLSLKYHYPFALQNITIHLSKCNFAFVLDVFQHNDVARYTQNISVVINSNIQQTSIIEFLNSFESPACVAIHLYISKDIDDEIKKLQILEKFGNCDITPTSVNIDDTYFQTEEYLNQWPKITVLYPNYIESQEYNTYFNKRLFIAADGSLRNSPESIDTFDTIQNNIYLFNNIIKQINIKSVLTQHWTAKKDLIEICKDCELRYLCVDNRRLLLKEDGTGWYCETECKYNPYICLWSHETEHISALECGNYNKNGDFIVNNRKVKMLIADIVL